MKARQYINMMGMAAAVLLSSCVKDTLYDTPHPDYGKIAVTADWSARGEGIDIPATWTVTMGDYTGCLLYTSCLFSGKSGFFRLALLFGTPFLFGTRLGF